MRAILPKFNSNVDHIHLTFRCDPRDEEALLKDWNFNLAHEVMAAAHRYEIQLGAVFNVHFVNDQENRIIATQQWMVTGVKEEMIATQVSHNAALTRNVFTRTVEPVSEMTFFDHNVDPNEQPVRRRKPPKKRPELEAAKAAGLIDVTGMSPAQLQKLKKKHTGRGFRPGTDVNTMIQVLRQEGIAA